MNRTSPKRFRATLERSGPPMHWTIIYVPFDVAKTWGTRRQLRVNGEVNGFPFRSTIFPTRSGRHFLIVNKATQKQARVAPGATAKFALEPDLSPRIAKIPSEFDRLLRQERSLKKFFDQLTLSMRADIGQWIGQAKQSETRKRRAEQMAVRLMETMEAEIELPPQIRLALAGNPRARRGWDLMSLTHKRRHLLAIFYYRTPEGRARRIAQALEAAERVGAKVKNSSDEFASDTRGVCLNQNDRE